MKKVFVMRGIPGAGKSTRARQIVAQFQQESRTVVVCSSDDFFVCEHCGTYKWDRNRLHYAHLWCQTKFRKALAEGTEVVVVDNTNVTIKECAQYVRPALEAGYEVEFVESGTPWAFDADELVKRNVHGVPREGIERMLQRWVPNMTVELAMSQTPDEEAA